VSRAARLHFECKCENEAGPALGSRAKNSRGEKTDENKTSCRFWPGPFVVEGEPGSQTKREPARASSNQERHDAIHDADDP
jgi:hypothetical protein